MTEDDTRIERLRERFRDPTEQAEAVPGCPAADVLRASVTLEAPPGVRREVLHHVAVCPACAVAWETVREVAAASPASSRTAAATRWPAVASLAAAAALAVAFLLLPDAPADRPPVDAWRTAPAAVDWSTVPDEIALPRDGGRLAWPAGPEGTRYAVRVSTVDLETLARAADLTTPSWEVPPDGLASLVPGTVVLWQVEATTPDGRRSSSPTFRARIGPSAP